MKRAKVKQHGVSCEPQLTYKDVYAMRKTDIDKAYKMALQLANVPYPDELELHALAWAWVQALVAVQTLAQASDERACPRPRRCRDSEAGG